MEIKMERQRKTQMLLSLLWIVIMINMIFNDIFSIMVELVEKDTIQIPGDIKMIMLAAAVITNIPIFMILLSNILKRKINRILNIIAGFFTIIYVIGGGSLLPHYIFIASIEVVLSLIIIITAWKWTD
jgi:Na+/melibiose symporter-like transporter